MDLPQEQRVETAIQPVPSPKVSVIVPVYKAEAYLNRCVDSLLAQTFEDFEILLIDDGSPDRSGEICDEYARKDPRVRVVHKENGGVSSARQCGLDNARGEYVIHADPDDWTEPEMLEAMYRKAKEENADMVICDFYVDFYNRTSLHRLTLSKRCDDIFLNNLFLYSNGGCWNKLVKRSCFRKYGVAFPKDLFLSEDFFVTVSLLANSIKVVHLGRAFYHYTKGINSESLTRKPMEQLIKQKQRLNELLKNRFKGKVYSKIDLYVKVRTALSDIADGGECLRNFSSRYAIVIKKLQMLPISTKQRILLSIAYFVSPKLANWLRRLR